MKLPRYTLQPESRGSRFGFRIHLDFNGDLLPLPNQWFRSEEVARLRIKDLQRQDHELWNREAAPRATEE